MITMTTYKIEREGLTYASKMENGFYNHKIVEEHYDDFPTWILGGRYVHKFAYFVFESEWHYDPMRDFNPRFESRKGVAGPFPTQEMAQEWIDAHAE